MIKRARLFAAMLVLAGACTVPERADAMPILCRVAESILSDIDNATSSGYSHWILYWLDNCAG